MSAPEAHDREDRLPEVLDLLVVGGGPGGTTAAFRARELGLAVLVIDYDDLMKRIRDYSKDKLILPGFGGGDKMKFPRGGSLVSTLHFSPIDKDEMCGRFKELYRRHDVPAQVGVELIGLERRDDLCHVLTFDHTSRREKMFRARSVVLAIGRGVPRRFDIPGNSDGIAYRLSRAEDYVGDPVCVVGGGTSAAEAVIAISNAKTVAQDPTGVTWSYRGDRMPRVSRALAEVFFEAYVGNGNIRYYPKSEPAAIVSGDDRREYLAIRVDRRSIEGRPHETTHLEFLKECCIACIGEDIPESLLASMGIQMFMGGPNRKKRVAVTRYLESPQPNVFFAGDLLSQAYFVTDDFGADPAGFQEVKHRGNIKSAMRDGVLVAEVIKQRLEGRKEIEVRIEDADDPTASQAGMVALATPVESSGPPPASLDPQREVSEAEAFLVRVLPGGVEEGEHPVRKNGVTTLGRGADCDLAFPSDTMLAERHASISHNADGYFLRDDASASGVFLRVPVARRQAVRGGDLVRVGRQFLLFESGDDKHSLIHYDSSGAEVGRHELPERSIVVGRQAPDITLDPRDRTLSRRQLAISVEGGGLFIKDLKSVNGSYLRVRSATPLVHGSQIRVGQQVLVFSCRPDAVLDHGEPEVVPLTPPSSAGLPPPAAPPTTAAPGVSVLFRGRDEPLAVKPGQTLCEVAEEHGIDITAECHSGICGSDPIRIVAGSGNLDAEAGEQERETLEEICELKPGECRLACMVKAKGPVEVEILKG